MTDKNPASERQLPGALSNASAVARSLLGRLLPASYLRPARQSAWIGSFRAARMLGTVAMLAVSARILGPEGFGELAVIIAAVRMAYRLLSMPGDEVITTFVARDLAAGRGISAAGTLRFAFALSQMLALAAYAVVALAAYALSGLLGSAAEHRDAVLLYGLGGIALATMRESLAVLQVSDRLRLGVAVAAVGTLVRVAALLWVWHGGYGLVGVVAAYVAGDAVTGVGLFVVATSSERKAGLPGFLRTLGVRFPGWDVIRFQAASFGRTSLDAATLYIDVLLLAGLVSAAQLGIYRAASQLINATKLPFWSATRAVRAECARLWHTGDIDAVRRICIRFTSGGGAAGGGGVRDSRRIPRTHNPTGSRRRIRGCGQASAVSAARRAGAGGDDVAAGATRGNGQRGSAPACYRGGVWGAGGGNLDACPRTRGDRSGDRAEHILPRVCHRDDASRHSLSATRADQSF